MVDSRSKSDAFPYLLAKHLKTTFRIGRIRTLALIMIGSLFFLGLKVLIVFMVDTVFGIEPWINYLIVTTSITSLGWLYHSKVSFGINLSGKTFGRYVNQAVILKITDYFAYNFFVYILGVDIRVSVLFSSAMVFVIRVIVYIKYVFRK